ncbi:MAG: GTP cyclohydrolase I FolE [Haliscomenobacter sp.]|nr:GTP cyclohydrolase I FolE [Haliscomenobacter sp.]
MRDKEQQGKGSRHPVRTDVPLLSEQEKLDRIAEAFATIMETLGLDLEDDSLKGTPARVAKMYISELFKGLDPDAAPDISTFENHYQYNRVLIEKNILVKSTCEHHFLPILGHAHVGYYSSGRIIGLSKLNRIVDYYCRRPQVQERLTRQILIALQEALQTQDVIVVIDAVHLCVTARGIEDPHCSTYTLDYGGRFEDPLVRKEFLDACPSASPAGLLQ